MYANPLYARYRGYSISPPRNPDTLPSERVQNIHCINFILSFLFSISTYSLCFTNIFRDTIINILYSNSTLLSVLTPQPWIQYFQWFAYLSQLPIINLILYGNMEINIQC